MPKNYSLDERIKSIREQFGVEFIDYGARRGNSILITSGAGIGMGLMDVLNGFRYFLDIDTHRNDTIDWEAIAIILCAGKPKKIAMAGWFTIDDGKMFGQLLVSFWQLIGRIPEYIQNTHSDKIELSRLDDFIARVNQD